jgi:glycosyltransferase involved in cell wall biosynthesis
VLDEARLNGFQILHRLVGIMRDVQPQVVHTHRLKENILGSLAARLAGNVPSLRTVHGAPEHNPSRLRFPKRMIALLDRLCGRFLQRRIVAVSDDLAALLRQAFPEERICVIENGIDIDSLGAQLTKRPKTETESDHNTFKIGLAGRLVRVKRADLFIQTAKYVQEHYPQLHARFHIFGDGPLRGELTRLARDLGTKHILRFEGHSDHIHEELQNLDALLMTSDHEGLPMILLEAMAVEVPIIAHAVGGIPSLLDHGSCGVLVHNHSAAGYAKAIYELATRTSVQEKLTANALNRVKKQYSATANAAAYCSLYNQM